MTVNSLDDGENLLRKEDFLILDVVG